MTELPELAAPNEGTIPPKAVRHFIAINHHRFHDTSLMERAVSSVMQAADRLRTARPGDDVRVILFHQPEGVGALLMLKLAALPGLEIVALPSGSNGGGLNTQIDIAIEEGATYFYRADADDPVFPDRFLRQAQMLENTDADVTGGGLTYANLETGERFDVLPPTTPGPHHFLTNCAMLHPTLAFKLDTLRETGIRYWGNRLEDKQLGLQIARAGLRLVNEQVVYGEYNLNPAARSSFTAARMNLSLNLDLLRHNRRPSLVPLAFALFLASTLLPSHTLRRLRQLVSPRPQHRAPVLSVPVEPATAVAMPYSESVDGSDTERTGQ